MNRQVATTLNKEIQARFDGLKSSLTGMGTSLDKLTYTQPTFNEYTERELLNIYLGIPQIQTVIDLIPEDIYQQGFEVESENEQFEHAINAEIERLKLKESLVQLKKYERIYANGGLLYFLVDADISKYPIQAGGELSKPMPQEIKYLNQINVVPSEYFNVSVNQNMPTDRNYNKVSIQMDGHRIDESRFLWSVNNFQPTYGCGLSRVSNLAMIGNGLFISAWSAINMIYEAQLKVYKSNSLQKEGGASIIKSTLNMLRKVLSSQSAIVIGETESFEKQNLTITGFKEIMDYLNTTFCSIEGIPVEIFLGQSKGVISLANNPQSLNYYSSLVKKQELEEAPKIKRIIDIILKQDSFRQYQGVEYCIEWEDIFTLDDNTKADIRLKNAQADAMEIDKSIASPQQIAKLRYPEDNYDYPQGDFETENPSE